jgi:catechol 2,3-dioxygenase-like lactoylglutathione lyase family enzyme
MTELNSWELKSCKLAAFAAALDRNQARAFYHDTLGLPLISEDDFALVFAAAGTNLRISPVEKMTPAPYTVLGWEVPDIVAMVTLLAGRGVKFERYGFLEQDELGIWSAPGGTRVAWFQDPSRNILSLAQHPAP